MPSTLSRGERLDSFRLTVQEFIPLSSSPCLTMKIGATIGTAFTSHFIRAVPASNGQGWERILSGIASLKYFVTSKNDEGLIINLASDGIIVYGIKPSFQCCIGALQVLLILLWNHSQVLPGLQTHAQTHVHNAPTTANTHTHIMLLGLVHFRDSFGKGCSLATLLLAFLLLNSWMAFQKNHVGIIKTFCYRHKIFLMQEQQPKEHKPKPM